MIGLVHHVQRPRMRGRALEIKYGGRGVEFYHEIRNQFSTL